MNIRRFFSAPLQASLLLGALLFAVTAAAFAQTREDVRIYIPPVAANAEQARFFHENFTMEISAAGYTITESEKEADYSMRITVMPNMIVYTDGTQELAPPDEHQYILRISLVRNSDNVVVLSLFHYFTNMEEMYEYNLYLIYQAMANVPMTKTTSEATEAKMAGSDNWNNKRWYFGGSVFFTPRLYRGSDMSGYFFGAGIGLFAELILFKYLCLGTGAELTPDRIAASPRFGDEYWNAVLQIPLRLQAVIRPGRFMLEPYLGIAFNFPLLPYTIPPLFSAQAGFQSGITAGPGIFFADIRFAMDIGKSGIDQTRPQDTRQYNRYMVYLGLGYKFGAGREIPNS